MKLSNLKHTICPIILLVFLVAVSAMRGGAIERWGMGALPKCKDVITCLWGVAFWLVLAWIAYRAINTVWESLGYTIPNVLKTVVCFGTFAVAATVILRTVFEVSLTNLWAASGAMGLFGGFALRDTFSDTVAGIAMNVQRPFKISDWIRLCLPDQDEIIGCVADINWRTTLICTVDNVVIVIPNRQMSGTAVTNFSRPNSRSRFYLTVHLDAEVPTERALEAMLAGVRAAEGLLEDLEPKVRIDSICRTGIIAYNVEYWLNVDQTSPRTGRHNVAISVLKYLREAEINPAYQKHIQIHQGLAAQTVAPMRNKWLQVGGQRN